MAFIFYAFNFLQLHFLQTWKILNLPPSMYIHTLRLIPLRFLHIFDFPRILTFYFHLIELIRGLMFFTEIKIEFWTNLCCSYIAEMGRNILDWTGIDWYM